MLSGGKEPVQTKQDDKLLTSSPSDDNSASVTDSCSPCSSFRSVYYGAASAGAVPFVWEAQPGTPKNIVCLDHHTTTTTASVILPPLTPPPSYHYFSTPKTPTNKCKSSEKTSKRHKILNTIFSRRITSSSSKTHSVQSSPISSLSSSSSSSSATTMRSSATSPSSATKTKTPLSFYLHRISSPRSSFDSRGDDGELSFRSPTSTLYSPSSVDHEDVSTTAAGGNRGCYSMVVVKNALLCIVGGHGSGQASTATA